MTSPLRHETIWVESFAKQLESDDFTIVPVDQLDKFDPEDLFHNTVKLELTNVPDMPEDVRYFLIQTGYNIAYLGPPSLATKKDPSGNTTIKLVRERATFSSNAENPLHLFGYCPKHEEGQNLVMMAKIALNEELMPPRIVETPVPNKAIKKLLGKKINLGDGHFVYTTELKYAYDKSNFPGWKVAFNRFFISGFKRGNIQLELPHHRYDSKTKQLETQSAATDTSETVWQPTSQSEILGELLETSPNLVDPRNEFGDLSGQQSAALWQEIIRKSLDDWKKVLNPEDGSRRPISGGWIKLGSLALALGSETTK